MKKQTIIIICAMVLVLSMVTVFATPDVELHICENGKFIDREIYEVNLDAAINEGLIKEADREYYLYKYDYCITICGSGDCKTQQIGKRNICN